MITKIYKSPCIIFFIITSGLFYGCTPNSNDIYKKAMLKSKWNSIEREAVTQMATEGNLTAIYRIGAEKCLTGNRSECLDHLRKAAEGGHYAAMQRLGFELLKEPSDPAITQEAATLLMLSLNFPTSIDNIPKSYKAAAKTLSEENLETVNQMIAESMAKLDTERSTAVFFNAHKKIKDYQKEWITFCDNALDDIYCRMTVRPLPVEIQ